MTYTKIRWRKESKNFKLTNDQFEEKIKQLRKLGYKRINPSYDVFDYNEYSYSISEVGKYKTLAVVNELFDKEYYTTNFKDDEKNQHPNQGKEAFDRVAQAFKKRTGKTITKIFGSVEEIYKNCIPRQLYFINEKYIDKANALNPISHCSAIDYCSQYPSMLCGRLPDSHTAVKYSGTVKPTKEYPFAFYLNSGHCAEYGVFDTHDWCKSLFRSSLLGHKQNKKFDGDPFLDYDKDVSILMKASDISLRPEMEYFYSVRKKDPIAKLVMNAFIGFLHKDNYISHKQAHIAAIVIARANDRMRKKAEEIQFDLGYENIIHICVDGCIYKGLKKFGGEEKALNNLCQEFYDCELKITGTNSYVAMKDNKVVKFKHGSYDSRTDGQDINKCDSFDDMYKRYKKVRKEMEL